MPGGPSWVPWLAGAWAVQLVVLGLLLRSPAHPHAPADAFEKSRADANRDANSAALHHPSSAATTGTGRRSSPHAPRPTPGASPTTAPPHAHPQQKRRPSSFLSWLTAPLRADRRRNDINNGPARLAAASTSCPPLGRRAFLLDPGPDNPYPKPPSPSADAALPPALQLGIFHADWCELFGPQAAAGVQRLLAACPQLVVADSGFGSAAELATTAVHRWSTDSGAGAGAGAGDAPTESALPLFLRLCAAGSMLNTPSPTYAACADLRFFYRRPEYFWTIGDSAFGQTSAPPPLRLHQPFHVRLHRSAELPQQLQPPQYALRPLFLDSGTSFIPCNRAEVGRLGTSHTSHKSSKPFQPTPLPPPAQVNTFVAKYGDDRGPEAMHFRAEARALLARAKAVLDGLGVPFWLSSGTLLGWLRQCDFIAHSKDVDVGIFIDDYQPALVEAMAAQGLQLTHRFGRPEDSFELSFASEHGLKLDMFFFYRDAGVFWNGGTQARTGRKFKYSFAPFEMCWGDLAGIKARVPCPPLPYIKANYGEDWNTPVKKWDWKSSPPNVQPNGAWPESEWAETVRCFNCQHKIQ